MVFKESKLWFLFLDSLSDRQPTSEEDVNDILDNVRR